MPNTTNFNWPTPADTDLVKDGAAAIRNLGNGIDTSLIDLKGGTTGQILSKASNADMDFTFITPNVGDITEVQAGTGISVASGTGPIPVVTNSMATEITAKGDLIVGTGNGTFDNLPLGTNGYTLVADSSVSPTGLKWAAPSAGALTYITGASFTTASSVSLPNDTFTSTYENYVMYITFTSISANNQMCYRMRASGTDTTSAIYYWSLTGFAINNTAFTGAGLSETSMKIHNATSTSDYDAGQITIYSPKSARITRLVAVGGFASNGGTVAVSQGAGFTPNTTSYDALTFFPSTGTMTGFYKVYGIANS